MSPRGQVLVIGAGGLGCPALLALGAAGVRHLAVMDDDRVDPTNLHRQIWHGVTSVGEPKALSLARALGARFSGLSVTPHVARFTVATAGILDDYEVIVDGTDNFASKFLLNDAAVLARKPLVHGAAVEMRGQLLTVPAGGRPCYRCLFEEPPPSGVGPSCAEAGVLGPVPGVIGALQGVEAARLVGGQAGAFTGRLMQYDGWRLSLREVRYKPNPSCDVCGNAPQIRALHPDQYPPSPAACP